MSEPEREDKDQLWSEATLWFARMRSPDVEAFRREFEEWLGRGALHRRYYNRASEYWVDSGTALSENNVPDDGAQTEKGRAGYRWKRGLVASLSALCLLLAGSAALWFEHQRDRDGQLASPAAIAPTQLAQFATPAGGRRTVRLADGSIVTMGEDTVLRALLSASMRRLDLDRGNGRFEVAHEARPFVVFAGGGSVTARGTLFDVAVRPGRRVLVRLIRGSIDVRLPSAGEARLEPAERRLQPGESISFEPMSGPPASGDLAPARPGAAPATAAASRDYRDVRLADIIAEANRDAPVPIRFADRATGERKVSGRFRTDDNAQLAERLAGLFDLVADRSDPAAIMLRPR
jgi:transmembrane sensor